MNPNGKGKQRKRTLEEIIKIINEKVGGHVKKAW